MPLCLTAFMMLLEGVKQFGQDHFLVEVSWSNDSGFALSNRSMAEKAQLFANGNVRAFNGFDDGDKSTVRGRIMSPINHGRYCNAFTAFAVVISRALLTNNILLSSVREQVAWSSLCLLFG
ncbi:hypothetical protein ACHAW5_005376 [Stephanodiscus triporus]|uniref:Uncharacterized protein n=1 Tax=Stephanodiscus triporus TaxID=2934178 RepID=A0ABD3Q4P0_9STRA